MILYLQIDGVNKKRVYSCQRTTLTNERRHDMHLGVLNRSKSICEDFTGIFSLLFPIALQVVFLVRKIELNSNNGQVRAELLLKPPGSVLH